MPQTRIRHSIVTLKFLPFGLIHIVFNADTLTAFVRGAYMQQLVLLEVKGSSQQSKLPHLSSLAVAVVKNDRGYAIALEAVEATSRQNEF